MPSASPNYLAGGDINPSRFVSSDPSNNNRVIQSTANLRIQGVSQEGTKAAPQSGASALAAASGDQVTVYGDGDQCLVTYGDTVTRGQRLKADADGKAVPMATSGAVQNTGAIALQSGSAGDIRMVLVKTDTLPATAS